MAGWEETEFGHSNIVLANDDVKGLWGLPEVTLAPSTNPSSFGERLMPSIVESGGVVLNLCNGKAPYKAPTHMGSLYLDNKD